MGDCVSGAIKVVGPTLFAVTSFPDGADFMDQYDWGPDSVFEHYEDGRSKMPDVWKKGALLYPGVSHLMVRPPTADEAVGLSLSVLDKNPGDPTLEGWTQYSEVSALFLPGTAGVFVDEMGNEPVGYPGEDINSWRLPNGTWRVRGYAFCDKSQWRNEIVGNHPDSIDFREYPQSGRTWDSLPCQIRLEFWREDDLRPREDVFPAR